MLPACGGMVDMECCNSVILVSLQSVLLWSQRDFFMLRAVCAAGSGDMEVSTIPIP